MEKQSAIYLTTGSILLGFLSPLAAQAQITPDNTLPNNTEVTNQGDVIQIDGGTTRGSNLFHSFQDFSVPAGSEALFNNNADTISNILSRVTGGNISEIEGAISTMGTANLFLINPAGIIFGENASLNVGGSFIGTSADSLLFPDGIEYSATDIQSPPILTINAPIGLGFRDNPGDIVNSSTFDVGINFDDFLVGLRVSEDQTLALIGGDVSIEGGFLSTVGGRIELGSVAENSTVSITPVEKGFDFGYEEVANFQDISLTFAALVNNIGVNPGDIELQGRNISLIEGSGIGIDQFEGQAGDINIIASESLTLDGNIVEAFPEEDSFSSSIFIDVINDATGEGSNINIDTPILSVTNGAQITSTNDFGQGADININASEIIVEQPFVFEDPEDFIESGIFANVFDDGTSNGGDITIATGKLSLNEGAQISTSTFGSGNAGDLLVNATESIELVGTIPGLNNPSSLGADVGDIVTATGNGGDLTVNTARLEVRDGAQIGTVAQNEGNGGNLTINASESVLLSGFSPSAEFRGEGLSGIFVSAEQSFEDESGTIVPTTGNGGTLDLTTQELIVENGASISADTFSLGAGGNANINVNNLVVRNGSEIRAGSLLGIDNIDTERGNGGTLNINASDSIEITGIGDINGESVNSSLLTLAESNGDAGDLTLTTNNLSIRDGGTINANSVAEANAGDLSIEATNVEILNTVDASTGIFAEVEETASGKGGNINLASEQLTVSGERAGISVGNFGIGDAGNLNIEATRLTVAEGAEISSSTFGEGNAGNTTVKAQESVVVTGGENNLFTGIFAQVNDGATGDGGLLTIDSPEVKASNNSRISVGNRGIGDAGDLTISTNRLTVESGAQIFASTFAQGNAGKLTVNAAESVDLSGESNFSSGDNFPSGLFSQVNPGATGTGGSLILETTNLRVADGAKIQVSTFGEGDSGDLSIRAGNIDILETSVNNFFSTGIFAEVARNNAKGNAGDLTIESDNLSVRDGGQVSASTLGEGNAGNLSIEANNSVEVIGVENPDITIGSRNISTVSAVVGEEAVGDGGNLTIDTKNLRVADGGQVSVSTFGRGNAGDLQVNATDSVEVSGTSADNQFVSQLTVDAAPNSIGSGGNLTINAQELNIDGGQISAATASGEGGNITLQIDDTIILNNNSLISAAATETANGGNIDIDTTFVIASPDRNSDIIASAGEGRGGRITIDAEGIFGLQARPQSDRTNDIDASGGVDGEVIINTPDVDTTRGLVEIPQNIIVPEQTTAQACRRDRTSDRVSGLIIKGKGGIPPLPTEPFISDFVAVSGQQSSSNSHLQSAIQPIKTSIGDIYPARSIVKTENGEVILTAHSTTVTNTRTPQIRANCVN